MKKIHSNSLWPPCLQKDKKGNLILYPTVFLFPLKGYIIPDETIREKFIKINIPIILLGFLALIHITDYGFNLFLVTWILWATILYIVQYNFFKKYPLSKRKFSWKEHFKEINKKDSKFCLCVYIFIWVLMGIFFIKDFIISTDNAPLFIGVIGLLGSVYMFLLTLLAIIYRNE